MLPIRNQKLISGDYAPDSKDETKTHRITDHQGGTIESVHNTYNCDLDSLAGVQELTATPGNPLRCYRRDGGNSEGKVLPIFLERNLMYSKKSAVKRTGFFRLASTTFEGMPYLFRV